jgi:hypothetical protein
MAPPMAKIAKNKKKRFRPYGVFAVNFRIAFKAAEINKVDPVIESL